jgi:hypothetical protein
MPVERILIHQQSPKIGDSGIQSDNTNENAKQYAT